MQCMSMPEKYLDMGSFYEYYSGKKVAPVPTIFIHGNHESVNYLKELYFGGWVAPNIYYMGYSGVVSFGGIRIGGLSGIFKESDYKLGHFEKPPYNQNSLKSSYHIREYEVFKLSQIEDPIDIFLSHDWPTGIYHFGNEKKLLKQKPFFSQEIQNDSLGSTASQHLMLLLKPKYWFSAHLHVKFAALFKHSNQMETKFLALDKCLPGRDFLQIIDVTPKNTNQEKEFYYDPEWISILRATHPLYCDLHHRMVLPKSIGLKKLDYENLKIPKNFEMTAPCFDPSLSFENQFLEFKVEFPFQNPQTHKFMNTFGITIETEAKNDPEFF